MLSPGVVLQQRYRIKRLLAHRINPQVPFAFAVTLAKSMALDRKQRYQSAKDMLEALKTIKQAIEAEIAERERQEEEARQRKASRRRQSKDSASAKQSSEQAERPERAKKAKKAVVAEAVPIGPQDEEKLESPEKVSCQRKSRQPRQRKAPAGQGQGQGQGQPVERSKRAKKAVAAVVAEREAPDEESSRREESARLATVLDEAVNAGPAIMALAAPQVADTQIITRQPYSTEQPADEDREVSEPAPARPATPEKTLRVALGAVAVKLLIAIVVYLLWNITLVVYLLWNHSITHR